MDPFNAGKVRQEGAGVLTNIPCEQPYRLLIEAVKDYAIFTLTPAGFVASWNMGAERIKGYPAAEIVGQHFSLFYLPEDIAAGKLARELAIAESEGRVEDEGWRLRRDGTCFWANVVITAVRDAAGQLVGFAKVTRDMTERRQLAELERASAISARFPEGSGAWTEMDAFSCESLRRRRQ